MCFFFFFKQKTAYEMRISDWSSDVCSSDLNRRRGAPGPAADLGRGSEQHQPGVGGRRRGRHQGGLRQGAPRDETGVREQPRGGELHGAARHPRQLQNGSAAWRERGWPVGEVQGGGVRLKKKK